MARKRETLDNYAEATAARGNSKHAQNVLLRHFLQALGGSLGHMAGGGVAVVYLFTAIYGVASLALHVMGKASRPLDMLLGELAALSVLFLVVGYVSNRPELYNENRRCR